MHSGTFLPVARIIRITFDPEPAILEEAADRLVDRVWRVSVEAGRKVYEPRDDADPAVILTELLEVFLIGPELWRPEGDEAVSRAAAMLGSAVLHEHVMAALDRRYPAPPADQLRDVEKAAAAYVGRLQRLPPHLLRELGASSRLVERTGELAGAIATAETRPAGRPAQDGLVRAAVFAHLTALGDLPGPKTERWIRLIELVFWLAGKTAPHRDTIGRTTARVNAALRPGLASR